MASMFKGASRHLTAWGVAFAVTATPLAYARAQGGFGAGPIAPSGGGPGFAPGPGLPGVGQSPSFAPGGRLPSVDAAPDLTLPPVVAPNGTDPLKLPPASNATPDLKLPPITGYAPPTSPRPHATRSDGAITLAAKLTTESEDINRGLVWRVFGQQAGLDGKLPLVASAKGGTMAFDLEPGSYLVHASFGRAGATKRITVGRDPIREELVLDAGGLKLDAVLSGGLRIPADKLKFSIYEGSEDIGGDRALIIPNVSPNTVVRLNSGTYHVVSTYGSVNAVIRADIRVEAGKLTEASVEHRAAQLTMKLVRVQGGEAIADTSWSVLTDTGDIVKESVGAFASMVLAEGEYTIVAKNRDRIYQRDFTVEAGRNRDVEVVAGENGENAIQTTPQ